VSFENLFGGLVRIAPDVNDTIGLDASDAMPVAMRSICDLATIAYPWTVEEC
jgi:hypothetical protein